MCNNNCSWILIILVLIFFCGGNGCGNTWNNGNGNGCGNDCGC